MTNYTCVVRGTRINATVINAYAKRINSLDEIITNWSNAACLEAAVNKNTNWLKALFDLPVMRVKSGDLSKLGKEVLAYTVAHFPRVKFDKETQNIGLVKYNAESPLATMFIMVGADEAAAKVEGSGIVEKGGKFYRAHGDFALTFPEFKALTAQGEEGEEDVPKSLSASAFIKQMDKALEAHKGARFVGSPEEIYAALAKAKDMFMALDAQVDKIEAEKLADARKMVDVAKSNESDKAGSKGKSTRAGGKVDKKDAA